MNARIRRILSDYEQIKKDFSNHKSIAVEPIGAEPYEKFKVTYYVNGIYLADNGDVQTLGRHIVNITLHSEYPRYKPICTILTPIWHPNFKDGQICIGDIWGAGESLSDIIVNIGDMIQYKSWNSFSPLSADAAKWAMENKHLFPVGTVDLWTGEEVSGQVKPDFDIDLEDGESVSSENSFEQSEMETGSGNLMSEHPVQNDEPFPAGDEIEFSGEELKAALEDDFVITSDELEGVEFVPASERMHNSYAGHSMAKGGRINFKTIFTKGILYGLIGGLVGWILMEVTEEWVYDIGLALIGDYSYSNYYAAYDTYIKITSGFNFMFPGMAFGMIMGLGEGIYYGSRNNALKYGAIGLGVGTVLGFISGYVGQSLYNVLLYDAEYASLIYLSFARAICWALVGAAAGAAVGLIKPAKMRVLNCILGGFAGGFIGGFLFDFVAEAAITSETDTGMIPRMIGIVLMGALIGLGIGLLEQFAKPAWLKVIRGEFEGKEYLVFEGVTSIGNSGKNTIVLFKDKLVAPHHCEIIQRANRYELVDKGSPTGTLVNGMRIQRHILKQGDAIALGNSVLIFNTK